MARRIGSLWKNSDGAVAPTVALSLTALIAAGGIAFDYSRMATMDTELQSAADQAALAGATQLDGETNACSRAANAAVGMLTNRTYMANDNNGTAITIPLETACDATGQVQFYKSWDQSTDTGIAATSDADAKFIVVTVNSRTANFALTPIVAALSSGTIGATAVAGLDSAICKVPPLMLCNPNETSDPDFTIANYVGKGVRLVANDGGGVYGPGNFGFLDAGAGNGASTLAKELGGNNVPGDCVSGTGVDTETGSIISVRDALNTRFGIYDQGLNQPCGNDGSLCPPSTNIRQDLVLKGNGNTFNKLQLQGGVGNQNGWQEATNPYPGAANITTTNGTNFHALSDTEISAIAPMGYPEDMCHAFGTSDTGDCANGRIGDGNWDRYAYFKSNSANYGTVITSPATMNSFLAANMPSGTMTPTRYQVYQWEMAHSASRLNSQSVSGTSLTAYGRPNPDLPGEPTAIGPSASQVDRRVLSVAVIDCTAEGVSGHTTDVNVKKWIDIFLVEPALARTIGTRTENGDIYVEIIGTTQNATNQGAVQLVKKSIPYLIE